MVRIVGHRGARNLWPENSLTGFRNLREMPVEAVEFDIHQSSDGGIVVIHDPLLERTVEGQGAVGARTLSELTSLRLRDSSDCIPTLDDVLSIYADTDFELHIEIKTDAIGDPYDGLEARALAMIERHALADRSRLTCFAPAVLEQIRRISPSTPLLASIDRRSSEAFGGLEAVIQRFSLIPDIVIAVEKSLLRLTQKRWLDAFGSDRIGAWVPNEIGDIRYWMAQPIRQITSDRPDLALQARNELMR